MKLYVVVILQLMIWSGFSLIEWISRHDQLVYKIIMFFIFFYLAYLLGNSITKSSRKSIFITALSLIIYGTFHYSMAYFFH